MFGIHQNLIIFIVGLALALVVPAQSSASAVDEYTEFTPNAGGKTPSSQLNSGSGSDGAPTPGSSAPVAGSPAERSEGSGSANGGTTSGEGSNSGSRNDSSEGEFNRDRDGGKDKRKDEDVSTAAELVESTPIATTDANLESIYGSGGGGVGIVLPLILGLTLLGAGLFAVYQRRRE